MKTGKHYLGIILALTIALLITSATGDIYFDKVSLLLPFDGTDGARSTTDISNSNHSLVFGGDAKISAGKSKYGGTSCYFDGKGDYLTVADSEDWNFGTGDFTIEFWVWRTGLKNSEGLIGSYPTGWQSAAPLAAVHDNKILITEGTYSNGTKADDAPLIISTWYHIAFSRRSGTMWLFIDGKLVKFGEDDHSYDFNDIKIGSYNVGPNNYYFSGYLDDIRLTKGVARYTSDFTVPSAMKDGTAPAITQLTEPTTVAEGESVALTVTAVGSAPMTYQWSKEGVAINGATEATLLLTDTALSAAGDYTVAISNSGGDVVSDAVKLSVVQSVGIVTQPEGGEVTLGDIFTMNVVASGTEPISYKWRHGGELVNGATGSSLTLAKLTAADLGSYYVVVSNAVGELTSNTVVVSMSPVITQLTGSMVPVFGETVELSVTAVGTMPISYQWYLGGVSVEGGTGSTLSLANFQVMHAGDYYVVVSNSVGTLKSDTVTLSAPPVITQWTESKTVGVGGSVNLSVTALGTPPLSYQWSKEGVEISGASGPTLAFAKAAVSDTGDYSVAVSNALGQVKSDVITLTIDLSATIISQPIGGSANLGESYTFEVVAEGTKPITYKWYHGDDLVQGSTQSALHLAELQEQDAGDYHVVVSNQTGTETSDTVTLFVVVPPSITRLTDQVSVVEGDTLKLTVTAVGTEPKYQWYHDKNKDGKLDERPVEQGGELIEFAITSVLTIANVKPSDAGEYALDVRNSAGHAGAVKITVIVNQPARIVTQPKGGSAVLGDSFTFEVDASGDAPIVYEWYHDGALKDDSTGSSLKLPELAATDAGDYHVVVSNEIKATSGDMIRFGIEKSDIVSLIVLEPPGITQIASSMEGGLNQLSATAIVGTDPTTYAWSEDGVLVEGDNVELTVTLTGTEPISYQWYHGEELVEDGTESTLRLTDVQGEDSGDYHVMVSNQLGAELSEVITLSVVPPPAVTELAGSINVVEGEGVELTVTAVGSALLTYQWSKGEEMIGGATAPTLDLGNVKASAEADYKLAISNAEGLAGSVVITVDLVDPPVIVTQPVGGSANLDEAFTFEVVAEGTGLEYEWYHDGAVVGESTGSFLQLTNVQAEDAGDYHVVVSNIAGEVTSDTATLELVLPPEITGLTKSKEGPTIDLSATATVVSDEEEPTTYQWSKEGAILQGDNVELTVTVTGTEPITYEWYHGEELVEGGNESTLRLTDVKGGDSGEYYVKVSNQLGTEFSEVITLSVVALNNLSVVSLNTVVNNYSVPTGDLAAGAITITVTDASAFSQGDQIMIIQMQHTSSAGTYELRTVESIANNDITVNASLTNSYYQSTSSKAQIVRVPQYTNVSVHSGGSITAAAWDGNTGGILAFNASGNVTVDSGGSIVVSGLGFRGAPKHTRGYVWQDGYSGEGYTGGYDSFGSGSGGQGGSGGIAGAPAHGNAGGGGGGGNGTAGDPGHTADNVTYGKVTSALGGSVVGSDSLSQLFFGGGGGSGGFHDTSGYTGPAGNGGGIIYITAAAITLNGTIEADGGDAVAFSDSSSGRYKGGSGGGAGGSIYLKADNAASSADVHANGGSGSDGYIQSGGSYKSCTAATQRGGNGGAGRIKVEDGAPTDPLPVVPTAVTELAESIDVVEGEDVELSVTAVGNESLTYQWSKGEKVIEGATAPTLGLGNVGASNEADYKLAINNAEGLVGSVAITVVLADPPVIVTQPGGDVGDGLVTILAGSGTKGSADATGTDAQFHHPVGVAVDDSGNVYVADSSNHRIRKITPEGVVTTLAGSGTEGSADGTGADAQFRRPEGVAVDGSGNVYVADKANFKIRKITPEGVVTTLAGSGSLGSTDGTGADAKFNYPVGVAADASENVYVGDSYNHRIRKITPEGVVTTLAGSGTEGSADGTGADAQFAYPEGVAVDGSGNVYVAGRYNNKIRKITPEGVVTTLAGKGPGQSGFTDGTGADAKFYDPEGVAVDGLGNVYVADLLNNKIRKITPEGVVTTLAGSGTAGSSDGTGADAQFYNPEGVAVDGSGNVYVADTYNHKIRKIIVGSVSANLDEAISFEVVAEGTEPMTYEWYHIGAVVGEATGSSLQLTEVQAGDAGDYHVVVTNIAGEVTSDTVTLEVVLPPEITQLTKLKEGPAVDLSATAEVTGDEEEPTIHTWSEEGALLKGDNVELTVTLTGTEPISYQWYQGEESIEGGTESTLRLTDVQGGDSGDYHVVVSNQLGTELSEVITLSVVPPPAVTELAGSINVVEGEGVELSVTAISNESLTYQWSKGEEVIEGGTSPTLDLGNVKASAEADYKLAISNTKGLAGSVVITVALADPPIIVTQPQGGSADLGETFTFEVVAEGNGLEYQWHKGSTSKVLNEFEANWDDGEEVEGTSIAGATQIKDGSLHITEAANGKSGGFTVSDFTDGEIFNNFEISFRLYMTDSTCCGKGDDTSAEHRPAEGLSISIGSDLPDTIRLAEEGAGEGIRICFDTWDSGGGEAPAIDVWRGNDGDGPTVYIPFDDTAGYQAVGLVGDPGLTYIKGPELGVPALNPNGVGTAVRFDGSKDQALRVKDHPDINVTRGPWEERTWGFWFKAEKLPAVGQHQVLYEEGAHVRGISIYLTGTDNATEADLYMMAWNRAETRWGGKLNQRGGEGISAVKTPINVGEVYHMAFVMDGDPSGNMEGTLTGYLNGKKIGEVSGVHLLYNHSGNIAFGNKWQTTVTHEGNSWGSGGMGFTGVIDDASFYSTALSEAQVLDHFEAFRAQDVWPGGMVARQNFNGVTSAPEEAKFKDANGDHVWMWTQGEWADVKVSVLDGDLKINFKGHEVISQELPTGWKPLEGPEWLFAARTGGANQTHWIDDLKIKIYADSVSTANSALVAEATGSTLPLTELEGEDAGDYYVVVSNIAGEVTSDTATLTVDLPPTVTQLSALSNADGLDLSATAEVEGEELLTYEWSQNGSFLAGGDIDLVATVIGTEPISYEWYYKDLPVEGAKGNTLRLAKAGVDASGDYHVVVSNRLATVTSDTLAIAVVPATTATELAGSVSSVYEGETIELSVTASGLSPLAYEWSLGETVIDGATSATLSLNNLEADAAGDYKLAISHDDRLVGEAVISIIIPAARVVTQPVGGSVALGGSYTFEVIATGTEPIIYEWYHWGELIEEATGSTLQLTELEGDNAGQYHVVVSNETLPFGGTETSDTATLTVLIPLAITHLTESELEGGDGNWQWGLEGGTVSITVTAVGTPPLTYQWNKDGTAIDGETSSTLTLNNLIPSDAGYYTVNVSNAVDQVVSELIEVAVVTPKTAQPAKIVLQPEDTNVLVGENVTLRVIVDGTDPISYQWYYKGKPINGETNSTLSSNNVQRTASGNYYVVVSNEGYPWGATETSDTVTLTVETPPEITQLTESVTLAYGESIELSVTANGDEPLTYQWSKDSSAIDGATNKSLTLDSVSSSEAGDYTVVVTNAGGQAESDVVTVNVIEPVTIVTQPEGESVILGDPVTLKVVVEGVGPISYFWYHDGELVEGGTESTLRLANVQAADAGGYRVIANNQGGKATSETAEIIVLLPPVITRLTESMILAPGESVKLSVTAVGDEPLTYQWHKDGSAIEGATSPTLALNAMSPSDTGDYTVRVTNTGGQTESAVVTVAVVQAVKIVTQPEDVSTVVGESATLKVVVEGSEPIEYFWSHDGDWVEGGTESTLRLASVKSGDYGAYNVLVRNQGGIEISKPAQLTVLSAPEIMQLTDSLTLIEGESVELSVKADSDGPLVYQWSFGGDKIEGATHPALLLAKAVPSDAGDYTVVVSNAAGQVESGVVTVTVIQPVRIITQPEGTSAMIGDTVTLKVVVEGTEPISYFWYHDGGLVDGGMESTLRLANVQSEDSGSYNVIARNKGGTAISETVELKVLLVPEITQLKESLMLIEGGSGELSVKAVGSEPLAYQWSKGGEKLDGATHPTLLLAKAVPSAAGDYTVVVSNAAGEVESGVVTVTVIQPVRIVTQLEGTSAILGDAVTLKVVVEGTEPISYFWYHDGESVEGGAESTLKLANVQAADSGVYHLVVSNSGGTEKSKLAKLTVLLPPVITQLTESLSVIERESIELSVKAVGTEPVAYQWNKGGEKIEGATHPILPLSKVAPAAAGDYTVTVSNVAGQAESETITVSVIEPIRIITQPKGVHGILGETVTLTVVVEGTEPINYSWLHNGKPIVGGRHSTLTLTDLGAKDSGEYIVFVNNSGGMATSETAILSLGLADGVYFLEDFDDLTLGPWISDNESIGDDTDWTTTPPTDWATVQGVGHEPVAAAEFDGWTFVDPVSWHKTAGPERDQFTKGSGVIAVADSAQSGGKANAKFSATMVTPPIDIADAQADSLVLNYDSSWRKMQRKRVIAAFEEDFEGDDVNELVTIDGTAVQALEFVKTGGEWPWLKLNGILKVTEAVFSQSGGMLIEDFSDGSPFNEFEISFRMFMGRGTSRPADGLSISIGNDLPTLAYPAEEGASDAAFRVCFDAWDSGGGEAPAIEIFNGKKSVAIQKFHGQSGASDSEKFVKEDGGFLMMWDNSEWTDVNIRVANGLATVNFRGYDVIGGVPIDLDPIEAAQFLFAARTGGANQKHYIDDIKIRLFDSSSSRVTVAYDGDEPVTLLDLNSQTPTAYDESVSLALNNPEGAKSAVVTWDYQGHDNWWAIDNITVASDIEPTPALPEIVTDKERYSGGKPITVSFSDGPGNPRDWIGIYRPDTTPGEQGSLAWVYVSGSTTASDGLANGSVAFTNNLSVGDYVARFFKNDGYSQLAAAVAFTVGDPPGVATDKLNYAAGEAITVSFSNGTGNPSDWISLMPLGETSSIDWAYVGGSRTPSDGLTNGTLKFADGLPDGEYRVLFLANDGYHQLAKTDFTVAGQVEPPALGFANKGDGTITLTFEGRLQTAPTINGPWQDVDAPSPVTLPTDQSQQFTRSVR